MKRIPSLPPGITNSLVSIEDYERQPAPGEIVPNRQARLTSPDHNSSNLLWPALDLQFAPHFLF